MIGQSVMDVSPRIHDHDPNTHAQLLLGVLSRAVAAAEHTSSMSVYAADEVCAASFTATAEARALLRAQHLQGTPLPAAVQLTGGWELALDAPDMTTRIYLPDGTVVEVAAGPVASLFEDPLGYTRVPGSPFVVQSIRVHAPSAGRTRRIVHALRAIRFPGALGRLVWESEATGPSSRFALVLQVAGRPVVKLGTLELCRA